MRGEHAAAGRCTVSERKRLEKDLVNFGRDKTHSDFVVLDMLAGGYLQPPGIYSNRVNIIAYA